MRLSAWAAILGCVAIILPAVAKPSERDRPLLLSTKQFECLLAHAGRLKVGKRGAIIDFAVCPPIVEDGFYPTAPSETKRRFLPADLECLSRARDPGKRIAFNRRGGRVAVYLRPCGTK